MGKRVEELVKCIKWNIEYDIERYKRDIEFAEQKYEEDTESEYTRGYYGAMKRGAGETIKRLEWYLTLIKDEEGESRG